MKKIIFLLIVLSTVLYGQKRIETTNSSKILNHLYSIREDCLAATTITRLSEAIRLAEVGNLENLKKFMLKYYPKTMVLKSGFTKVKLIEKSKDGKYMLVDLHDGGDRYWIESMNLE